MVYTDMKRAHDPIGVYRPFAPELTAELRTYAEELELLTDRLESILPERFLATAGNEGLSAYEELFGPAMSSLSVTARRERLRKRLTLGNGDFTLRGIRQALDSFGLRYVISEFPRFYRLNIVAEGEYDKAQQAFITREVTKIIPPHIDFQIVFNTLSWEELDGRNKRWSDIGGDNMTWAQWDALSR